MRKGLGVLLGLGGAALVLFLKNRQPRAPEVREIVLKPREDGCGIRKVAEVELRILSHDEVHWTISNPEVGGCDRELVKVCLDNWKWFGIPDVPPPIVAVGSDPDESDRGSNGFCRRVRKGGPPMRIPARVSVLALPGTYTFDVVIDGQVALDPKVEIVV